MTRFMKKHRYAEHKWHYVPHVQLSSKDDVIVRALVLGVFTGDLKFGLGN